jgi:hypothetical protein
MAKAARAFSARQDVLINNFLNKLWSYAIANAMKRRELPLNANWRKVEWQTPRSITVDVGREAQARREDVKSGLMTLADFFGEQGLNWKDALEEIAAERQLAGSLGITIGAENVSGAPVIDPAIVGDGGSTPPASTRGEFAALDCGTGAGGFKPGNDCARGGAEGKKKDEPNGEKSNHPAPHEHQVVTDFEERVREERVEHAIVVDESGNVLFEKKGTKKSVTFDPEEMGKIKNGTNVVLSHNHPGGSSFSKQDIMLSARNNISEIRVITSSELFVMRRPAIGWPDAGRLEGLIKGQRGRVMKKMVQLHEAGKISIEDADKNFLHEVTKQTSELIGATYERHKI